MKLLLMQESDLSNNNKIKKQRGRVFILDRTARKKNSHLLQWEDNGVQKFK